MSNHTQLLIEVLQAGAGNALMRRFHRRHGQCVEFADFYQIVVLHALSGLSHCRAASVSQFFCWLKAVEFWQLDGDRMQRLQLLV